VDKESLGLGNDSVLNDPELSHCTHGKRWDLCEMADCREIWELLQQQREERSRDEWDWSHPDLVEKKRGKKSQYEIALEQKQSDRVIGSDDTGVKAANGDDLPDPIPARDLRKIFPDAITLRAAVQFRAITLRQAQVLKGYFDSDQGLPDQKRWAAIGEKIGWSGKTVEREFLALVEKFLKAKGTTDEPRASIEVVHVRGERRPRYYRRHSQQFGEWKREWKELITDREVIRQLRKDGNLMDQSEQTPIPSSPVNRLFGALIRQLANDLPKDESVRPQEISASDWEFNLRRAQRLLAGKKHLTGPWTASEVAKKLARGGRLCRGCRTYLIRGFRINGRKITRAREYCDDACKMRAERRKKKMAVRKSQNAMNQK